MYQMDVNEEDFFSDDSDNHSLLRDTPSPWPNDIPTNYENTLKLLENLPGTTPPESTFFDIKPIIYDNTQQKVVTSIFHRANKYHTSARAREDSGCDSPSDAGSTDEIGSNGRQESSPVYERKSPQFSNTAQSLWTLINKMPGPTKEELTNFKKTKIGKCLTNLNIRLLTRMSIFDIVKYNLTDYSLHSELTALEEGCDADILGEFSLKNKFILNKKLVDLNLNVQKKCELLYCNENSTLVCGTCNTNICESCSMLHIACYPTHVIDQSSLLNKKTEVFTNGFTERNSKEIYILRRNKMSFNGKRGNNLYFWRLKNCKRAPKNSKSNNTQEETAILFRCHPINALECNERHYLKFYCATCDDTCCDESLLSLHRNHKIAKNTDYNFRLMGVDFLGKLDNYMRIFIRAHDEITMSLDVLQKNDGFASSIKMKDSERFKFINNQLKIMESTWDRTYQKLASHNNLAIQEVNNMIERFVIRTESYIKELGYEFYYFDPPYELQNRCFLEKNTIELYKGKNKNRPIYGLDNSVVVRLPHRSFIIGGERSSNLGKVDRPWGICSDKYGNIFVTERHNHRVQVFNSQGKHLYSFGSAGSNVGEFNRPAGVAIDPMNRVIIVDKDNHRVQIFSIKGEFILSFGKYGNENGDFNYPWDVTVTNSCSIIIADSRNHRIQAFNPYGEFLWKIGCADNVNDSPLDNPRGICSTPDGYILVTDFNRHSVVLVHEKSLTCIPVSQFVGDDDKDIVELNRPQGIICDDAGNVIISDSKNNRIVIVDSRLEKYQFVLYELGLKNRPQSVCLTSTGRIVMTDEIGARVTVF